jgi:hypothetical protein
VWQLKEARFKDAHPIDRQGSAFDQCIENTKLNGTGAAKHAHLANVLAFNVVEDKQIYPETHPVGDVRLPIYRPFLFSYKTLGAPTRIKASLLRPISRAEVIRLQKSAIPFSRLLELFLLFGGKHGSTIFSGPIPCTFKSFFSMLG